MNINISMNKKYKISKVKLKIQGNINNYLSSIRVIN